MPGTGTKTQIPSGKWRVRIWLEGRRVGKVYGTEAEADIFLAAHQEQRAAGEVSPTAPTLLEWGEIWLRGRLCRSVETERSRWVAQVAPAPLARLRLDQIGRPQVIEYVAWLRRRKVTVQQEGRRVVGDRAISWQTQKHALKLVQLALDGAADKGLIRTSPAAGVRVGKREQIDDDWSWLEQAEIDLLGCALLPQEARDLYQVAVYAGLRAGEIWALRWEDVRLAGVRPELEVRRSHGGATKSGKPRRVPLLVPAVVALRRLWERAGRPGQGLVFPGQGGERHALGYDGGWADKRQRRRVRGKPTGEVVVTPGHKTLAGITRAVRFHDLRHTCASHLIQGTWGRVWALEEVRDFLGHSSISVTQRYAHLGERLHRAAAGTPGAGQTGSSSAAALSSTSDGNRGGPKSGGVVHSAPVSDGTADGRRGCSSSGSAGGGGAEVLGTRGDTDSSAEETASPTGAPGRSRTCDPRLRRPDGSPVAARGSEDRVPDVSPMVLAQRVLELAAAGTMPWTEMQDLAGVVLEGDRRVQLALRVQAGGEDAVAAGLELAALVARAGAIGRTATGAAAQTPGRIATCRPQR